MARQSQQAAKDDDGLYAEELERTSTAAGGLDLDIEQIPDLLNFDKPAQSTSGPNLLVLEGSGGSDNILSSFSLDDLEDLEKDRTGPSEANFDDTALDFPAPPPPQAEPAVEEPTPEVPVRKVSRWKLNALIGAACLLLVAGLAAFLLWPKTAHKEAAVQLQTFVRHSIPIPHLQQEYKFFFLSSAGQEKHIISLGVQLDLIGVTTGALSPKDDLLFRDLIYAFLKDQQPQKGSLAQWQKTIEKGLPAFLQAALPERKIAAVEVNHLNRL